MLVLGNGIDTFKNDNMWVRDPWIPARPSIFGYLFVRFRGNKGMDGSWEIFRGLEVVVLLEIYTPQKTEHDNRTVPFFELEIIYLCSWVLFYCQSLVVFGCETDFIDEASWGD